MVLLSNAMESTEEKEEEEILGRQLLRAIIKSMVIILPSIFIPPFERDREGMILCCM